MTVLIKEKSAFLALLNDRNVLKITSIRVTVNVFSDLTIDDWSNFPNLQELEIYDPDKDIERWFEQTYIAYKTVVVGNLFIHSSFQDNFSLRLTNLLVIDPENILRSPNIDSLTLYGVPFENFDFSLLCVDGKWSTIHINDYLRQAIVDWYQFSDVVKSSMLSRAALSRIFLFPSRKEELKGLIEQDLGLKVDESYQLSHTVFEVVKERFHLTSGLSISVPSQIEPFFEKNEDFETAIGIKEIYIASIKNNHCPKIAHKNLVNALTLVPDPRVSHTKIDLVTVGPLLKILKNVPQSSKDGSVDSGDILSLLKMWSFSDKSELRRF